ncbi:hypothetical protein LCGC14_0195980 [marine sediment metagenome]|uniref:Uncharacterized protein n=1 Tax=marine sediment metagenome TaxID=412755 RepID=A0A0F9UKL8_9ZZZZ
MGKLKAADISLSNTAQDILESYAQFEKEFPEMLTLEQFLVNLTSKALNKRTG